MARTPRLQDRDVQSRGEKALRSALLRQRSQGYGSSRQRRIKSTRSVTSSLNLPRLSRNPNGLVRFVRSPISTLNESASNMIRSTARSAVRTPINIVRRVVEEPFRQLFRPFSTLIDTYNFARTIDKSFQQPDDEEQEEEIKPSLVIDKQFAQYTIGLYNRLDKIIDLLGGLSRKESIVQTITPSNVVRRHRLAHLAAGSGLLFGGIVLAGSELLKPHVWAAGIAAALRGLRNRISARARSSRLAIARRLRRVMRSRPGRASWRLRAAARVSRLTTARTSSTRVAGARNIARIPRLNRFFSGLRVIGRSVPLLLTILTPIMEGIEANDNINELIRKYDAGEIPDEATFNQLAAEEVVQAVLDTLGIIAGGSIGAALGAIVAGTFSFGLASFLGGAAGGVLGSALGGALMDWLGPIIRGDIARAILSPNTQEVINHVRDVLTGHVPLRDIAISAFPQYANQINAAFDTSEAAGQITNRLLAFTNPFIPIINSSIESSPSPSPSRDTSASSPAQTAGAVQSTPTRTSASPIRSLQPGSTAGSSSVIIVDVHHRRVDRQVIMGGSLR